MHWRSLLMMALLRAGTTWGQGWVQLTDLPAIARDDASAFAADSAVFIGTGMDVGFQLTNDWHRYDPVTALWSTIAPMPATPRQYGTGFSVGGFGYVFGGVDANGLSNALFVHLPVNAVWYALDTMPGVPRSGSASFVIGVRAFIVGGRVGPGTALTDELWEYFPFLNTWLPRPPMPGPPRHLAAVFAQGGKAYVVGGRAGDGSALSDGWCYDGATDSWSAIAPLPAAGRYGAEGFRWPGGGLVVAGATSDSTFTRECWRYDATADSWSQLPEFPGAARKGGAGAVADGVVHYGTGSDAAQRYADWWALHPDVSVGTAAAPKPLRAHPNPTSGPLHLTGAPSGTASPFTIQDAAGRPVRSGVMAPGVGLDVSGLPPASYHLVLHAADRPYTLRFVRTP